MSDKLLESISALMDNEADDLELRRLLKEMEATDALASTWSRYHVARSVLHKEFTASNLTVDLTSRVRDALQAESTHRESLFPNMLPKMAVAAVVMFSVLLTAKLVVNQPANSGMPNNMVAAVPNVINPNVQRAGYIVGQPSNTLSSLRAQRQLQNNDIQRVEPINMPRGYIVLPAAEIPVLDPVK